MKALGIYKKDIFTGEYYKTGIKKGQPKTRKALFYDGVRHVWDWSVQLNYYRKLLEQAGFAVQRMFIQALCRDNSLKTAAERGITKPVYIIPIHRISDYWLDKYFGKKAEMLQQAIQTKRLPPPCSLKETWEGKKCLEYCDARENCPHAQELALLKEQKAI